MGYHLKKTVVLVGLMGAGKTAVGTLVAQKLGVPFLDSDHEIERAANMTVAEIFTRDGEAFFRAKESQVLERLLLGKPCILSTGGGAYLAEGNRALIAKHGVALWLRADLELLWSRVRHKSTRPLLQTDNPRETLAGLHTARTPIYQNAEIVVDSEDGLSLEDMAQRVIQTLLADPNSGVTKGAR
ncbi:MAG: shikimate kinase [Rhodobacteraceae bacterium]|nr:shikimate kinase [Paracoccaceae bacterium]